jgi:hypothetical protein
MLYREKSGNPAANNGSSDPRCRVARFFLVHYTKTGDNIANLKDHYIQIPNSGEILQMALKNIPTFFIPRPSKIYQK